jgi:hypothetical protein
MQLQSEPSPGSRQVQSFHAFSRNPKAPASDEVWIVASLLGNRDRYRVESDQLFTRQPFPGLRQRSSDLGLGTHSLIRVSDTHSPLLGPAGLICLHRSCLHEVLASLRLPAFPFINESPKDVNA